MRTYHKSPPQKWFGPTPTYDTFPPPFVHALSFSLEETGTDQTNPMFWGRQNCFWRGHSMVCFPPKKSHDTFCPPPLYEFSGVAPANQTKKRAKRKVHEFRPFLWILVFFLRKTSTIHIELLFRNTPAKSSWTDLSLVWFAGATPENPKDCFETIFRTCFGILRPERHGRLSWRLFGIPGPKGRRDSCKGGQECSCICAFSGWFFVWHATKIGAIWDVGKWLKIGVLSPSKSSVFHFFGTWKISFWHLFCIWPISGQTGELSMDIPFLPQNYGVS